MWLFIEASDVWLFRDGRPFAAGADHRARTLFPPNPSTLQGALRSKVLALYDVDLEAFRRGDVAPDVARQIGSPPPRAGARGSLGNLRVRGPFLARREANGKVMPYFSCPGDILVDKKSRSKLVRLHVADAEFAANWPTDGLRPLLPDRAGAAQSSDAFVSAAALQRYLNETDGNSLQPEDLVSERDLFERESRFGVGIDSERKRYRDGFLYQVEYARPQGGVGLLVQVEGLEEEAWGKNGLLSLGGERRAARYTVLAQGPAVWPSVAGQDGEQRFKLYLATPAYLAGGWQPSQWEQFLPDAQLAAAAVSRFQPVGGWDLANNRQKPMQRYAPAGSVYFFEGEAPATVPAISDDAYDAQIGYGVAFIGRW